MFTYFLIFAFANVAMFYFAHIRALKSDKRTFHEESVIEIEDVVEKGASAPPSLPAPLARQGRVLCIGRGP
ncbi:hypothetical protein [Aeromonas bivalvium]|uniref:hypothetical protein n=1 Tax=Aeromonas bivalvium TaxID=440079 RepID=UPI0012FCCA6B|nr:hypothetical protein [Aeromonas bivalvium]